MDNSPKPDTSTEEQLIDQFQIDQELSFDQSIPENWDDSFLDQVQFEGFDPDFPESPDISGPVPIEPIDLYGGINNFSQEPVYLDEPGQTNFVEPEYLQQEREESSVLPQNNFDLSAITLVDLSKDDPQLIGMVFNALEQKDQASQLEFFNKLGLDLNKEEDLKFIGKLNQIQTEKALDEGLNNIADNNSSLPAEDRLYTTADTKLYISDSAPDFNLSIEANPFEAVQVAEKTLFDIESKSFVVQPYYALSLKGAGQENSLNFLSNRQYDIELLTNQNKAIREAKHNLYNEVTAAPNTYFSNKLTEQSDVQVYLRQLRNFCDARGLNADDVDLKAKKITMDQWRVNDDHTSAVQQNIEIPYIEFNPKYLTKEILLLLESREHNDQFEAALLLKDHLGDEYLKDVKSNTAENKEKDPHAVPKSTLNISGGPEDKTQIAANTIAAKNFKEIKQDELLERPALALENSQGYPRTVADEIAAMSAKSIAAMIETVKKIIKLIIAAIRAIFNKNNENEYQNNLVKLKDVWHTPISSSLNVNSNIGPSTNNESNNIKGLEEPQSNSALKEQIPKESLMPLLNDPYTNQLNKEREGVSLEDFDKNIAKVYEIDGEQYIVVDVVNSQSVDNSQSEASTPYIKLVKEEDLPPQVEGSNIPTPITPLYLETIESKIKYLSIAELSEGLKNETITEFEGQYFEPLCSQYIEQARMFLGAEASYGKDPNKLSEESKLTYKEQFAIKAYQTGQVVSDQLSSLKSKFSSVFNKFKSNDAPVAESSEVENQEPNKNDHSMYIQRDTEMEEFFKVRHDNVSYEEIENYIGMVFKDEQTQELKAVLDIFADNLDKRAIVVPYEWVQDLDQITEKDVLYAEDLVNNSETIPLYELEAIDPVEELNIKQQFADEYLEKLKQETINNPPSQTDTYARTAQRDLEISRMELDGKLSVVGALVKTETGQYIVLASDAEGQNSINPEYKAVPITGTDHQITLEEIVANGIQTIPRKDIREWNTFTSLNSDNANSLSYLDPEVHEAITTAIYENREMELINTLENARPSEKINSVGSKLVTHDGTEYIGLFVKESETETEYYAVKAPMNQLSPIGVAYIKDQGVDIVNYKDIAQFQHSNLNQKELLDHDVYVALVNSVNNENEHEVIHLLSNLDNLTQEMKSRLFTEQENTVVIEKNQFIEKIQNNNLVKLGHLNAIKEMAETFDNSTLKNIVVDAAVTLTDPMNSKNDMIAQSMIHMNQRLDTLQQDLILQASSNLHNDTYREMFNKTSDHLVLPTAYGDAKFVNFNSETPEISAFKDNDDISDMLDRFNSIIEETGKVEIAIQQTKQEVINDHYLEAIRDDVKLHKLNEGDINLLKEVNNHIDQEFQLTGERLEALQPALNHSTSNYMDSVETEKKFVSEVLNTFTSELDNEISRKNDRSNDQSLG